MEVEMKSASGPESGPWLYKGVMVACGPPGLNGGKNILYRNNGDGTFTDVSEKSGILKANGTYGLGVLIADLDNDGWPDIYVANDSTASALYQNKNNGTFTDIALEAGCALSADPKPQAGISTTVAARGCAFGDFDNDGDLDIVVNTVNDLPQLLRCDSRTGNNWIKIKTIGTKSNRSGIGARIKCVTPLPGEKNLHPQIDEVRSGGGYFSQNDLRVHFRIGKAEHVELLEIRCPSGLVETLEDIKPNQVIFVKEGEGIVRTQQFDPPKAAKPSK